MEMYAKVTNGNTKLGRAISNINLPAIVTCRKGAPCFKGCYALKGHFLYQNVKNCMQKSRNTMIIPIY